MSFKSPDTGSEYKVVLENKSYVLCYRKVGDDRYRARIQVKGNASALNIKSNLKFSSSWGYKNYHFSVLLDTFHLRYAMTDAFQAIFNSVPLDEKEEEKKIVIDDLDESLDIQKPSLESLKKPAPNDDVVDAVNYSCTHTVAPQWMFVVK